MMYTAKVVLLSKITKMKKTIIYRILLGILVLLFGFGSIGNLLQLPDAMKSLTSLGYPDYFSYILGSAQLIAIIVLVIPPLKKLKEWALVGMIINLLAALLSHLIVEGFTPIILVILFATSVVISVLKLTLDFKSINEKRA